MSEKQRIVDGRVKYIESSFRELQKMATLSFTAAQEEMFRVYKNDIMKMVKLIVKKGGACPTCKGL